MGIIVSFGKHLALKSGSRLADLLACGTEAATGKAISDLCVLSLGWKASIFAFISVLKAGLLSGEFTPAKVISALLVFLGLGNVALLRVISILLDICGSS